MFSINKLLKVIVDMPQEEVGGITYIPCNRKNKAGKSDLKTT